MRVSLNLIAERLRRSGHDAYVLNGSDAHFSRIKLASPDDACPSPDTLHVCADLLQSQLGEQAATDDAPCPIALTQRPPDGIDRPCIVVETVRDTADLMNIVSGVKDDLDDVFARIGELAWDEDGLGQIVDVLSELVGNSCYVVDSSFKVMAITNDPDLEEMSVNWMHAARHGYLSYDVIAGLIRSNELFDIESSEEATIVNSEYFYVPFINYNLRKDGQVQGHLFVVKMYKELEAGDLELVNLIGPHVLRALQSNPSFQIRRGPLYEHFVVDWLEGRARDSAYVRQQLEALSFDADGHAVVAIIRLPDDSDFRREHLARLLEDRQDCRAVSHGGQVVALFHLKQREQKAEVLHRVRRICRAQNFRAFVSDAQDSLLDIPRAYRQAREAQRISDAMALGDSVVSYGDIALLQPFLDFSSAAELEAFCHPAVLALREYDQVHAVQLLPTLSAFLKCDRDVKTTADRLYVHRNTLAYRMRKILELFPLDLDDFATRHRVLESILIVENYEGILSAIDENAARQ